MIVKKTLSLQSIFEFTGYHLLWLAGWMSLVTTLYYFSDWKISALPFLPLPLIGTAVVFYIGFKNNQSYDRLWEARKIWSEITNSSRMLATMIRNYRSGGRSEAAEEEIRRQIIFRHIAYLYQLREQLLEPTVWEHVSMESTWGTGYYNRKRRAKLHCSFEKELDEIASKKYLSVEESINLQGYKNKAVELLNTQTKMIQQLYDSEVVNMLQQMEIQATIKNFHDGQSRMERIKQSPFPREYATFSFIFVCVFVFFLPFGLIGEFYKLGDVGVWLVIPVGVIISWIFVAMEMISDYCENPFEGLRNDTPMLSICREIEINMLQTIGEKDIPDPIKPKSHVLI
jgi:putative membrane protein